MNKLDDKKLSRLELYLKNMDLLKITPSVGVALYDAKNLNLEETDAILKHLKNWSVNECYIFGGKKETKPFIQYSKNTKNPSYKSTGFFLENTLSDEDLIYETRDTISNTIQQQVFFTDQYSKQYRIWGQDVISLYGNKPEIYEINPGKRSVSIQVTYPEDIVGILEYQPFQKDIPNSFTYKNRIDFLDQKTGKIKIPGPRDEILNFFVFRKGFIFFRNGYFYKLNYNNAEILNKLKEIYDQFNIEHPEISLEKFFPIERYLPDPDFSKSIHISGQDEFPLDSNESKKIIDQVLIKNQSPERTNESDFTLKWLFIEKFKKNIHKYTSPKNTGLSFYLRNNHPWIQDLINLVPLVPQIDTHLYLPGNPYMLDTEINIRLLSNSCKRWNKKQVPVQLNHLFCINKSFSEMKYDIDSLFLAGANHAIFNHHTKIFSSQKNSIDNLDDWDPNYSAYFDWFAYIHQLGHFFKMGIRRPELLVLYPSYNHSFKTVKECIREIGKTGYDYSLIDFDTFENNTFSSIEDKEIIVHNHSYRIILLPAVETISIETIQKLNRFYAKGGIIIAIGCLATKTVDNKKSVLLNRIKKQIWLDEAQTSSTMFKQHDSGGLGYFQLDATKLSNILLDLSKELRINFAGNARGIKYQVREIKDNYLFFFLNTNQDESIEFNFITKYFGRPYLWDFSISESATYPFWHISNHKLNLKVKLRPRESRFFIIDRKQSLKLCQLFASELDYANIIKQSENSLQLEGWQRHEGNYQAKIKNSATTSTLSYSVDKKLPILVIDSDGWYLDSDHFSGKVGLGDQSYPFPYKSTTITYHKVIILKAEYLKKKKLMLEIGKIKDWCKIYINNKFVKQLLFEPWIADISEFTKAGENKISIEVNNRLSNRIAETKPDLNDLISVHEYGLIGPIKIIPYSLFTLKL